MTDQPTPRTDRPIASTEYSAWLEVECVQRCGWTATEHLSREAVRHVKDTGHETAVKRHSAIHYHVRNVSAENPWLATSDVDEDDRR